MTDLTTATPAEIDTQLAALQHAEGVLDSKRDAAVAAIHRGLGEKLQSAGRGANRREWWPTSDADALAAMRSKGEELIGMMRPASALVQRYDEAQAALDVCRDTQAPLNAEYTRRGGWTRFFEVAGGHIHRQQHCPTLHRGKARTPLGWLIDMSGTDETKAIAELAAAAHILCSVCIPGAPVAAAPAPRKTPAEKAADKAAAERVARMTDEKLIADTDGAPLRVDGSILRTVRAAEIAAVGALWWAAYARHTGEPNETNARGHEAQAHQIAAALAHKRGTTPAAELAALVVKAVKKLRRDLDAATADAAGAEWTRQAELAAAEALTNVSAEPIKQPAPGGAAGSIAAAAAARAARDTVNRPADIVLAEQPQTQHAGRDEQGDDMAAALDATEAEQLADAATYAEATEAPAAGAVTVQQGNAPARTGHVFLVDVASLTAGAEAAAARHEVLAVRMRLAAIAQVTRELTDDQVAELGRRLAATRPDRSGAQLHPFLAARLARAEDGTGTRRCCTVDATDADCEQVHPGFTTPTAAYAALAAEIEAEADGPDGYLTANLGAVDDAAAAARDAAAAGATWATWEGHGRPADAMLYGLSGMVFRPEPVTITTDDQGRIVARSVGGRYINTAVATADLLLAVPPPAGDVAACRFCGCTEDRACPGGCAWATDAAIRAAGLEPMDGDLCTACLPGGDEAQLAAYAAEDAAVEAADDDEARRTGGTFAGHYLGPVDGWDGYTMPSPAAAEAPALPAGALPLTDDPAPGSWYGWRAGRRVCVFASRSAGDAAIRGRAVDATSPVEHYRRRAAADDATLAAAADQDPAVAAVLAIAAAAPTPPAVTVSDPAGLLELVEEYGAERAAAVAAGELSGGAGHDAYEARAAAVLARIAESLGLASGAPAAVPSPRDGDTPPAG